MSKVWDFKKSAVSEKVYGTAQVKVGKTSVKVVFDDRPDEPWEVDLKLCPKVCLAGHWKVSMPKDHKSLYSIAPINGVFTCKVVEFVHAQNALPAPKHYSKEVTKTDGTKFLSEYDTFTALLEILEGKAAGLQIAYMLRYNFGASEDGIVEITKQKSPRTTELINFLETTGAFDKGSMEYSENILPALQDRILKANRQLAIIMKDGWVSGVSYLEPE